MWRKVVLIGLFLFFFLKGQNTKNICLNPSPGTSTSISTALTGTISIDPVNSIDDYFLLSFNAGNRTITITRGPGLDTKLGYQSQYNISNGSEIEILFISSPPDLDPLTFSGICGTDNVVSIDNIVVGAIMSFATIDGKNVLQPDGINIKIPKTGAEKILAEQKIENWNGSTCSAINSQKETDLNYYFNFVDATGINICANTNIPINGRIINNFGGITNPIVTIKNGSTTVFNGPLTNNINIPLLTPIQGTSQISKQNWSVAMEIEGCIVEKILNTTIEQVNVDLARSIIIEDCQADPTGILRPEDNAPLRSGDKGVLGDLEIKNVNPLGLDNKGYRMKENVIIEEPPINNYNIKIITDPNNPKNISLYTDRWIAFKSNPKQIEVSNKLRPADFPNLTGVCMKDIPAVDVVIDIIKPTIDELEYDNINPPIACSGEPVLFTFASPNINYTYVYGLCNSADIILGKCTKNSIRSNAGNGKEKKLNGTVPLGYIISLGARGKNKCTSLQSIHYGSLNNHSDEDIQLAYDTKIICGWDADNTSAYQYNSTNINDRKIPLQPPFNTGVTLFNQNQLLGVSYDSEDNLFFFPDNTPRPINTPLLIFQDNPVPINTQLNPENWIDLTMGSTTLGSINYLDSLEKDDRYKKNNIDYGFKTNIFYYYGENISIAHPDPNAGDYSCIYPGKNPTPTGDPLLDKPLKTEIYYGVRRVPEEPRLLLDPGDIELCPGITKTLKEITDQFSIKDGIPATAGYQYNYNQQFSAQIQTVTDEKANNALASYNENQLKLKYKYEYKLTDRLSLCEVDQDLELKVDKACRDAMFVLKDPINSCENVKVKDIFDFNQQGFTATQNLSILDPSNTTGADGNTFILTNPEAVILSLAPSPTGITYYEIQFELTDKTGVTYLLPNEDNPSQFTSIAIQQLQNTDFDYTPNQFDIAGLYPIVLSPLLANNFSAGGIFSGNLPAGILEENSGQISLQTFFQNLSIQNPNALGPFEITYTSPNQCYQSKAQISLLAEIKIFNGISPNGDGKNEVLWIENAALYPLMSLEIYDQNGRRIFYQKGYNNSFNGIIDGGSKATLSLPKQLLPAGTYYYIIYKAPGFPAQKGILYIRY